MLKSNELRIGNYYLWDDKICIVGELRENYAHKVVDKCKKALSFNELHFYKQMQPIQLTEEWLIKFGFEKHHADFGNSIIMLKPMRGSNHEWTVKFYPKELGSAVEIRGQRIYFAHQLQNLYFALTGQELEIKEI